MRKDEKIFRHIEEQRRAEKDTGCCIRNDDSGCVQSSRGECSVSGFDLLFLCLRHMSKMSKFIIEINCSIKSFWGDGYYSKFFFAQFSIHLNFNFIFKLAVICKQKFKDSTRHE